MPGHARRPPLYLIELLYQTTTALLAGRIRLNVKCYTVQMYKIVGQTYIGKGHFEYHTSCELNGFFLSSPQLAILLLSVSFSLSLSFINNL